MVAPNSLLCSHFALLQDAPSFSFRRCLAAAFFSDHSRHRFPILATLCQHQLNVRNAPDIAVSASHGRRADALHARPVIGYGMLHVKLIYIHIDTFFRTQIVGILNRGAQQLFDRRRHAFLRKSQRVERVFHFAPLDQVQHQPRLLRRDAHEPGLSSKFHSLSYDFGAGVAGAAGAAAPAGTGAPGPPGTPAGLTAASVAALIECPLNWRVKLNSPSLCPTMFSVMYTGMNFFPLCTAMVWPTNSGIIVERRDHVRSTFFSLREFMPSTRCCRKPSTNGPFLVERAINSALSS